MADVQTIPTVVRGSPMLPIKQLLSTFFLTFAMAFMNGDHTLLSLWSILILSSPWVLQITSIVERLPYCAAWCKALHPIPSHIWITPPRINISTSSSSPRAAARHNLTILYTVGKRVTGIDDMWDLYPYNLCEWTDEWTLDLLVPLPQDRGLDSVVHYHQISMTFLRLLLKISFVPTANLHW